jgi:hypothetical protein
MSTDPKAPAVDTSAEAMAGASLIYADGVEAFADRTKTDDAGWMKGLALHLRETAQVLRSLASQPAEPEALVDGDIEQIAANFDEAVELAEPPDQSCVADAANILRNLSLEKAMWRARAEKAKAELAALKQQPVGDGERAWLIETARSTWWDGRHTDAPVFTANANDAIRFARFEDAEIARCWLLRDTGLLQSTEHVWFARAALSADQAGAK